MRLSLQINLKYTVNIISCSTDDRTKLLLLFEFICIIVYLLVDALINVSNLFEITFNMKFYYNTRTYDTFVLFNFIEINPIRRNAYLSSDTNDMILLRKVTSVIIIDDLLLTWQHSTTMNIAIAN